MPTFLATEEIYSDYTVNENRTSFKYTIFKNDYPFLIDIYAYTHTHGSYDCEEGNAEEWGAKAVYMVSREGFNRKTVVVYDDTVFVYNYVASDKKLDSENIAAIRKALGH